MLYTAEAGLTSNESVRNDRYACRDREHHWVSGKTQDENYIFLYLYQHYVYTRTVTINIEL